MQFDWWTFALQIINFAILAWLLQKFLYLPVQKIIQERRELVEQKQAKAEELQQSAQRERDELAQSQKQFEAGREKRLEDVKREIDEKRKEAHTALQEELDGAREKARSEIEVERKKALSELQDDIAQLAKVMASKILSEKMSDKPGHLQPLETLLSKISPTEKERILRDLAIDGAEIKIVTALPLQGDLEKDLRRQLDNFLGVAPGVAFEADPKLIGGAEIRFPHVVLKASMAESLSRLQQSMKSHDNAN